MSILKTSAICIIGCAFALAAPANAQRTRSESTQCVGHWSAPFPIQRSDGRPVYIERGLIASLADQTLVLGSPTFFWLGRNQIAPPEALTDTAAVVWSFSRAGALVDVAGTATGVPLVDSLHPRRTPRLVRRDDHTVLVAWATADSVSKNASDNENRIELATFDGHRWSAPTAIIIAPRVQLQPLPAVRAGSRLGPSIITATARDSVWYFVRVARQNGEHWITSDWRDGIFTVMSAVASPWPDGSVTMMVMGSLNRPGSIGPVGGVYSLHGEATATGYTWGQPQLVDSLRDSYQAFSSARLGGDSLVVVWYGPRIHGEAGVLNTALSIDRGRSWTLTAPLTPQSAVDAVEVAVDGNGGLHAVYRGAPEDQAHVLNAPGYVMHTEWRSGRWTPPTALSKEPSFTSPAVGASSAGGLMTIWSTAEFDRGFPVPKSVASVWTPCVGRP